MGARAGGFYVGLVPEHMGARAGGFYVGLVPEHHTKDEADRHQHDGREVDLIPQVGEVRLVGLLVLEGLLNGPAQVVGPCVRVIGFG